MVHTFNSIERGGTGAGRRLGSAAERMPRDRTDDDRIDVAVVEAVSTVADVEPCELDIRLYDVIDPDALDRVVRSGGPDVQVSFRFGAYHVEVSGSGEITVTETALAAPERPADQ